MLFRYSRVNAIKIMKETHIILFKKENSHERQVFQRPERTRRYIRRFQKGSLNKSTFNWLQIIL
jgi:hypothetical protein